MSGGKTGAAAHGTRRVRWSHVGLFFLYLVALGLLIAWEARDRLEGQTSECEFRDEPKSSLYGRPYTAFLDWASPATTGHVVAVAIPSDLEEIQSNVCVARSYLADVLAVIAKQNPAVLVIDKFFSPNSCSRTPQDTAALVAAVRAMPSPVVIGESTDGIEDMVSRTCLVDKAQLDFGSPNVVHGLTRLNTEIERFALRWTVLESNPEHEKAEHRTEHSGAAPKSSVIHIKDSLALAAVRAYDANFVQQPAMQRLIQNDDQAYSSLNVEMPRVTTTDLLCSTDDDAVRKRWELSCTKRALPVKMLGKLVVIGAEQRSDQKMALGRTMWGFQVQAAYMESLLSGDYLRSMSSVISIALFAAYVFVIEGVPILLGTYLPEWKHRHFLRYAYHKQRYLWVIAWTVVTVVGSACLCLVLRYLPPLPVYGDVLLVAITRLIYFSAESAEHPLTHAHSHTEEHHA